MTVIAWCKANGTSPYTYYSHLKVVRKELLKRAEPPLQQIVPLSVSPNVSCTTVPVQTQYIERGGTEREPFTLSKQSASQKIIVRKDGSEVEVTSNVSEEILLTLLRGLKKC